MESKHKPIANRTIIKYPIMVKYEGANGGWYSSYGKAYLYMNEFKKGGAMCSILFFHQKEAYSFHIPMFLFRLMHRANIERKGLASYPNSKQMGMLELNEDYLDILKPDYEPKKYSD